MDGCVSPSAIRQLRPPQRRASRHQTFRLDPDVDLASLPAAPPCRNYYLLKPHKAGPLGNVVFTEWEELQPWLHIAQTVKAEVAEKEGGCIIYYPPPPSTTSSFSSAAVLTSPRGKPASTVKPQYFRIPREESEAVYGSAAYIPRGRGSERVCRTETLVDRFVSGSSGDGRTSGGGETSCNASMLLTRQNGSCRGVGRMALPTFFF